MIVMYRFALMGSKKFSLILIKRGMIHLSGPIIRIWTEARPQYNPLSRYKILESLPWLFTMIIFF